jgi:hypothetical protein
MRLAFDDCTAGNKMAELKVSAAYFLERFKGIKAPAGQQYLALQTLLSWTGSDAGTALTAYQIPSIFRHFFVSCNNGRPMPASQATWLAENPLADPGQTVVTVTKNQAHPVFGFSGRQTRPR